MRAFLIFTLLMVFGIHTLRSQLYLKVYNYRPTGDFGYVFKPTFSAEIGYMPEFKSRVRVCFAATFLKMKPRMDVFPIYGVESSNTTTILPGTQTFTKYNLLQIHAGMDIALIKKKKFFFYLGWGIMVGAGSVDYTSRVETLIDEGYSGGGYLIGGRGRIGIQYDISDHIGIIAQANRSVFLLQEPAAINWANDYGVGLVYKF